MTIEEEISNDINEVMEKCKKHNIVAFFGSHSKSSDSFFAATSNEGEDDMPEINLFAHLASQWPELKEVLINALRVIDLTDNPNSFSNEEVQRKFMEALQLAHMAEVPAFFGFQTKGNHCCFAITRDSDLGPAVEVLVATAEKDPKVAALIMTAYKYHTDGKKPTVLPKPPKPTA